MEQKKDRRAVGVKVLPEGVEEYCERHTTALTELHEQLLRETEEKTTTANFLVGELEGAFLKMIVRMTVANSSPGQPSLRDTQRDLKRRFILRSAGSEQCDKMVRVQFSNAFHCGNEFWIIFKRQPALIDRIDWRVDRD